MQSRIDLGAPKSRFAVLILACLLAAEGRAQSLADPGFENSAIGTDFSTSFVFTPNTLTTWAIDSAIVAGPENGISPFEGSQMVRINAGSATDLYTLVDLSPIAAEIAMQVAVFDLTVYFNATSTHRAPPGHPRFLIGPGTRSFCSGSA